MKSISFKADIWARLQDGATEAAINKIGYTRLALVVSLFLVLSLSHTHTHTHTRMIHRLHSEH